jgi:hypothetical protein
MIRLLRLALPLLLLAAAGVYLWFQSGSLDRLVAAEVTRLASEATAGTPVTLSRARVNLAQASVQLEGLALGNPDGYRSASALAVERINVQLDTTLLDPRQIWLRDVVMEGAVADFEPHELGSNLQRLLERLAGRLAQDHDQADGNVRQLVIDRLELAGAGVRVWEEGVAELRLVPVPGLVLADIGIAEGGLGAPDTAALVLRAILQRALLAGAEPALRELIEANNPESARELREAADQGAERLRELLDSAAPR